MDRDPSQNETDTENIYKVLIWDAFKGYMPRNATQKAKNRAENARLVLCKGRVGMKTPR